MADAGSARAQVSSRCAGYRCDDLEMIPGDPHVERDSGGLGGTRPGAPSAPAFAALAGVATGVALVLVIFAGGYGYHRDELYFLAAGHHLAWGYADQGPLTPLLAHMMDVVAPGSLTVLRLPSALMAGATVCVTGLIAFELGARRRAQTIAASCAAVASVLLVVGHLLSTSTFDLLAWSIVTWLVARVIRTRDERLWLLTGVVAGIALLNKPLIAFLLAGLGVGLVTAGPRRLLRSGWLWAGLGIAALLWSPWLIWQASHGWPQLDVSSSIAAGGSASSQPRWALLPFQFLLVSPVLAPVWIAGLVALCSASGCGRSVSSQRPGCSWSLRFSPPAASPITSRACSRSCWRQARSRQTPGSHAAQPAGAAPCSGA